jgi:hypothetical protein
MTTFYEANLGNLTNKHLNFQFHKTMLDQTFECLFIYTETQWMTTIKLMGNLTEIITLHQ